MGSIKLALRLSASLCAYSRIKLLPIGFLDPKQLPLHEAKLGHFPELYDEKDEKDNAKHDEEDEIDKRNKKNKAYTILFRKEASGHKYTAGHALLIGASLGMEGAGLMAARAFFAAGGGILHVLLPKASSRAMLTKALPTAMFYDNESCALSSKLRPSSILIGPGLRAEDLEAMLSTIQTLIEQNQSQSYFILDAAAAKLIHRPELAFPPQRTLLLAHTGEWKALGGAVIRDTESLYEALDFYEKKIQARGHILIKDSICTLLSSSCENKKALGLLFAKPNAALSVAGSGDNLAGILLALFARKAKLIPKREDGQREDLQSKVLLGLRLLHQAVQGRIHPRSDEFALAIEKLLR